MKIILIKKTNFASIIFLSFFLTTNLYAQEKFVEKNLPQTQLKEAAKTKVEDGKILNSKDARNIINESLDKALLRKKTPSLMFDDEESAGIKSAVETFKTQPLDPELRAKKLDEENAGAKGGAKNESANEKFNIYLSSILYFNAQNWVIWVNNQKITSRNNKRGEEIFVKSISKEKVKLLWQMSITKWKILSGTPEDSAETPPVNKDNKVEMLVELKPNQTYVLSLKKVVEGKIYAKTSKVEDKNIDASRVIKKEEELKKIDVIF